MWTLTKRGGLLSYSDTWDAWGKFSRQVKRRYPRALFVAVPELHKNGTYHLHVATNLWMHAQSLRLMWHRALTGERLTEILQGENAPGNVDARARRSSSPRMLGRYIAKYMTKSVDQVVPPRGTKRYDVSRGIRKPRVWRTTVPRATVLSGVMHHVRKQFEAEGYVCSGWYECVVMGRRCVWFEAVNAILERAAYMELTGKT